MCHALSGPSPPAPLMLSLASVSLLQSPRPLLRVAVAIVCTMPVASPAGAEAEPTAATIALPDTGDRNLPPGVVIHHLPASTRTYIGSPTLAILPDGTYVAAHDYFGPASSEHRLAVTDIFASHDAGQSWEKQCRVNGAFWSNLFMHANDLHLLGVTRHHGPIVIRRSRDGGRTWTEPTDAATGLLTPDGEFHTAPMPMLTHGGRLWRGFEDASGGGGWGKRYMAMMLSAPTETDGRPTDLLDSSSWTMATPLRSDPSWLGGIGGWLEGNAVADEQGRILDILRVDTKPGEPERVAIVEVSPDGTTMRFDPENGFVEFPGGAKKFTIRQDPETPSGAGKPRWWTLATAVPPSVAAAHSGSRPTTLRNTLVLMASDDLRNWEIRCVVLHHPDSRKHAFQYVDWLFDGEDIVAVSRTAHDDDAGGAHRAHDANYLTFHRLREFRRLSMADSVVDPKSLGW